MMKKNFPRGVFTRVMQTSGEVSLYSYDYLDTSQIIFEIL